MPIHTDLSQLVFRKSIIEHKYLGGIEKFKEDFKFNSNKYNIEDNELISFPALNADELNLEDASNFHKIVDREGFIVGSNDFVVISRYGGFHWDNEWIRGNDEIGTVFFWDILANEKSIKEAIERSNCFVNKIENRYGSWQKWGEVIF
jgi:hypothetical protein